MAAKGKEARPIGKVGIIFSEGQDCSIESQNLAYYLAGLLSSSGYAKIFMVGQTADGSPGDISHKRIVYLPPKKSKPIEVPGADVTFGHWSCLSEAQLIIMTVNSADTEKCCEKLATLLETRKWVTVFSIQRGVRNSTYVTQDLGGKGFTVVEGYPGFSVVLDPKHSALSSTLPYPAILFERLSREAAKIADGPLNLLQTMDIEVYFRKVLTPFQWGVLIFENLYALNILTKGSINYTLANRKWRLMLALMIRENYQSLHKAARGGIWKPDLQLVYASWFTPWMLEMILILPDFLFTTIFWFMGLFAREGLISPGQMDLMEGRVTMAEWHLAELVDASKRHNAPHKFCAVVYEKIREMESKDKNTSYNSADLMPEIERNFDEILAGSSHFGLAELWYWIFRVLSVVSVLGLLLFLFVHDY